MAKRYKTKRFDTKKQAENHIQQSAISARPIKVKRANWAVQLDNGQFLMQDGIFAAVSLEKIWLNSEKEGRKERKTESSAAPKQEPSWSKEATTRKEQHRSVEVLDAIKTMAALGIEPLPATEITPRKGGDKLAIMTFADVHLGMVAWRGQTGRDYDLNIAVSGLMSTLEEMIERDAGQSGRVCLALLGDFFHTDGFKPLTPHSGFLLDADSRFGKVYMSAVSVVKAMIQRLLESYQQVEIALMPGNHDPVTSTTMRAAFSLLYAEHRNVVVYDTSPAFLYVSHGKTMAVFHHGNRIKLARLPMIVADHIQRLPESYDHVVCITGHMHYLDVKEYENCIVHQVPSFCLPDAFSHLSGYRAQPASYMFTMDALDGLITTHRIITNFSENRR